MTIYNTSLGQPLSPPVVATHRRGLALFRVGRQASDAIVASRRVTDVEVLDPIAPLGTRTDVRAGPGGSRW